jgi:two-component system sensor histidine kinase/response regulator
LIKFGLVASSAADTASALAQLEAAASGPDAVALLLVDAEMPTVDGFTFVEQLRHRRAIAETPVILLTSAGRPVDATRCRDLRIQRHLLKPIRQAQLRDAILDVFGDAGDRVAIDDRASASAPMPHRQIRILVADDNAVNQLILKRMLEKLGHEVTLAANGKEAFDIVSREAVDLVLMDVQMPVMDGLESTAAIRRLEQTTASHVPIIAVTAHAIQGDKERFLAAGMDSYISKPIERSELLDAIASATAHSR